MPRGREEIARVGNGLDEDNGSNAYASVCAEEEGSVSSWGRKSSSAQPEGNGSVEVERQLRKGGRGAGNDALTLGGESAT